LKQGKAGLQAALVRGNCATSESRGFPHLWNKIHLEGQVCRLVDTTHYRGKPYFPAIHETGVFGHYLRDDNTRRYEPKTAPDKTSHRP
jgi:hypothetical protein